MRKAVAIIVCVLAIVSLVSLAGAATVEDVVAALKDVKTARTRLDSTSKELDEIVKKYVAYPELSRLHTIRFYLTRARNAAAGIQLKYFNKELAVRKIDELIKQFALFEKDYIECVLKHKKPSRGVFVKVSLSESIKTPVRRKAGKKQGKKVHRKAKAAVRKHSVSVQKPRGIPGCPFTAVVASCKTPDEAYSVLDKLDALGIRAGVIPAVVGGRKYYRVCTCVKTREAASALKKRLIGVVEDARDLWVITGS